MLEHKLSSFLINKSISSEFILKKWLNLQFEKVNKTIIKSV